MASAMVKFNLARPQPARTGLYHTDMPLSLSFGAQIFVFGGASSSSVFIDHFQEIYVRTYHMPGTVSDLGAQW